MQLLIKQRLPKKNSFPEPMATFLQVEDCQFFEATSLDLTFFQFSNPQKKATARRHVSHVFLVESKKQSCCQLPTPWCFFFEEITAGGVETVIICKTTKGGLLERNVNAKLGGMLHPMRGLEEMDIEHNSSEGRWWSSIKKAPGRLEETRIRRQHHQESQQDLLKTKLWHYHSLDSTMRASRWSFRCKASLVILEIMVFQIDAHFKKHKKHHPTPRVPNVSIIYLLYHLK